MTGKEYVYRVSDADGNYIGVWADVNSELNWSQRLNTPGTTTVVRLARSANKKKEQRETLIDQAGVTLTDQSNDSLIVVSQTNNTIGEDTDVDLNYKVEVYVHYGDFEDLLTQSEAILTTQGLEDILVAVGAPLGTRIFSGIILDYEARYGAEEYIDVTIASNGLTLAHEIIKSGSNTTVSFSGLPPESIVKGILDTDPGDMGYNALTIDATGISVNQTFRLNTKLEGIQSVYNQTDDGWYWFGNVADNLVYFKNKGAAADHIFAFGKHIHDIGIRRSLEDLRNVVYFVGGDTGGGAILYKKYSDATSILNWRQGVYRITDRRFTLAASAQRYANKIMGRYKDPIYTTQVSIPSEVYDIDSISLGEMVGFANFDNFVDDLLLQIVEINYTPHLVTLSLGDLLDRHQDVVADVSDDLQDEQYVTIPSAPS